MTSNIYYHLSANMSQIHGSYGNALHPVMHVSDERRVSPCAWQCVCVYSITEYAISKNDLILSSVYICLVSIRYLGKHIVVKRRYSPIFHCKAWLDVYLGIGRCHCTLYQHLVAKIT